MSDLINRQDAIDAIEHRLAEPQYQHSGEDWYVGMNDAQFVIIDLPSVRPEKKGKWIKESHGFWECSECKMFAPTIEMGSFTTKRKEQYLSNFCPDCGADMRGGEVE